jgi:excisionase family DNA binding protein
MTLIGTDGPAVVVPARAAAFLESRADLSVLRVRVRGVDPEVSRVLAELREAAMAWRVSATGNEQAPTTELAADSEWLSTSGAGRLLGRDPRSVRYAIKRGALPATLVGRSYRVSREAVEIYRAARAAA